MGREKTDFAALLPFLGNIRSQKILEIISPSSSQLWPVIRISWESLKQILMFSPYLWTFWINWSGLEPRCFLKNLEVIVVHSQIENTDLKPSLYGQDKWCSLTSK